MSAITPIPSSRISDQLANSLLLEQLRTNQTALLKIEQQISTGRRVITPSDDAPASARAIDLQRLLERKAQIKTNLQTNQSYLSATDGALSSVSDLLNEARGLALSASGSTITDDQRATAAQQIDSILAAIGQHGKRAIQWPIFVRRFQHREYSRFHWPPAMCKYLGNDTTLQSYSDIDLLFPTNVAGSDVFGALSCTDFCQRRFESECDFRHGSGRFERRVGRQFGKHQSIGWHERTDYRSFASLHLARCQAVA